MIDAQLCQSLFLIRTLIKASARKLNRVAKPARSTVLMQWPSLHKLDQESICWSVIFSSFTIHFAFNRFLTISSPPGSTLQTVCPITSQAVRLAELEVEYQRMKKAMRSKMAELQDQLVMSGQSSTLATAIAADPVFAAVRAAGMPPPNSAMLMPQQVAVPPAMMPQQGQQQVFQQPMQTVHLGAPPPQQLYQQQYTAAPNPSAAYPSPGQYSAAPPPSGPFKREAEFHHVPPPKKADMRGKPLTCQI
jgi:hypothetical protein